MIKANVNVLYANGKGFHSKDSDFVMTDVVRNSQYKYGLRKTCLSDLCLIDFNLYSMGFVKTSCTTIIQPKCFGLNIYQLIN